MLGFELRQEAMSLEARMELLVTAYSAQFVALVAAGSQLR
ncbi:hypothetical protein TRICHSKD4_2604 [Roseibium sp. TrichSKD4]|nr:hypothetical protein TRICHSKD4_2604 [Roseibium sp. TrichSKD4]